MRRYLLAREGPPDGSLANRNLSTLAVLELAIAASLHKRKVLSRPEHVECSLIGVDESMLAVNDSKCYAYIVKNGLKHLLGLKLH
jgi:hypothetical protein